MLDVAWHEINFATFMSHEMPFMGYSLEIHGIFIKNMVHSGCI